jgi:hypothetical protein
MAVTLDNVSPGDLILYGANSGDGIYFFLALVYRQATQKELSNASLTVPAVMIVSMDASSSPGVFFTGTSVPVQNLTILPLTQIVAVYKASAGASDLVAAAAPYATMPWT